MNLNLLPFVWLLCLGLQAAAQSDSTYAEKLGYPKGAKVLILHVDDAGMSFDSNEGTIRALTQGVANSCSVMMPCPWVPGFVAFLKKNPKVDAGLHLTLTSEWRDYRWVPLSGKPAVPGLTDREGAFWPSVPEVAQHATADEVGREIRAQLERARNMGFEPTHLDSHMGTLFAKPDFMQQYLQLGMQEKIPVMFPGGHLSLIAGQLGIGTAQQAKLRAAGQMLWKAGLPVLDDLHNVSYDWKPAAGNPDTAYKTALYIASLKTLKPGLTMMILHCTAPTEVFPHISDSGPSRRADLAAMLDPRFGAALKKEGIVLTTWRELKLRRERLEKSR